MKTDVPEPPKEEVFTEPGKDPNEAYEIFVEALNNQTRFTPQEIDRMNEFMEQYSAKAKEGKTCFLSGDIVTEADWEYYKEHQEVSPRILANRRERNTESETVAPISVFIEGFGIIEPLTSDHT